MECRWYLCAFLFCFGKKGEVSRMWKQRVIRWMRGWLITYWHSVQLNSSLSLCRYVLGIGFMSFLIARWDWGCRILSVKWSCSGRVWRNDRNTLHTATSTLIIREIGDKQVFSNFWTSTSMCYQICVILPEYTFLVLHFAQNCINSCFDFNDFIYEIYSSSSRLLAAIHLSHRLVSNLILHFVYKLSNRNDMTSRCESRCCYT